MRKRPFAIRHADYISQQPFSYFRIIVIVVCLSVNGRQAIVHKYQGRI